MKPTPYRYPSPWKPKKVEAKKPEPPKAVAKVEAKATNGAVSSDTKPAKTVLSSQEHEHRRVLQHILDSLGEDTWRGVRNDLELKLKLLDEPAAVKSS